MKMIKQTEFKVSQHLLEMSVSRANNFDNMKTSLNKPTGDFFYDPWVIKKEFKDTIWEEILSTLKIEHGEARVIVLKNGTNYQSHADIDDRYHLTIQSNQSYLINLENKEMFELLTDGKWYEMDAGLIHSAANFGEIDRIQIVVRKLLKRNRIKNSVSVSIIPAGKLPRYYFDNTISPILNKLSKSSFLNNFKLVDNVVTFELDESKVNKIQNVIPKEFMLDIKSI